MATARPQEAICTLVPYGTLNLEQKADHYSHYRGLVVSGDTLIVLDFTGKNLWLHRSHDGKLLATSNRLESDPLGICLISNTEVAVIRVDCKIEILSFKSTGDTGAITRVRTLDVTTRLELCDAVAKVKLMDQLVVSGRDKGMMCWCIVSLKDGHVDPIHQICKGWRDSHMAIKNNIVYISCEAGPVGPDSHEVSGVYAYDIQNPHTRKFLYQHSDLQRPWGLTVDMRGFIFVCNGGTSHIHQLTDRGELVTIHKLPKSLTPRDIFFEDQHRVLYITSLQSNKITRYKLDYLNQGVPIEILNMDDRSIQLFEEALKDGKETVYNIRVMVVGHLGVGKTTLIKRLLGEEVKISERRSTEGIDVHVNCCDVSLSTGKWTRREKDLEQDYQLHRLARVLNEQQSTKDRASDEEQGDTTDSSTSVTDKEQVIIHPQGEKTLQSHEGGDVAVKDKDTKLLYCRSPQQDFGQELLSTASQQLASVEMMVTQSETNTLAMLKLLQENADKLKQDTVKNSPLTMWDFAGQYAFYTTHQTFLTRRAIYLLVSDISEQVTNLVADEWYFDSEGIMKCKVHELIEVWLNSIHSCAPSPESSIPPVILVGTHVDKISQKQSPAEGIELETQTMPTTTPAAIATNEQPRSLNFLGTVKKFFKPQKTKRIVEVTPVTSMTGAHAVPAEDSLKDHSTLRLWPGKKFQGTHHEICERYFRKIRSYLKDKPTRFHLVDEDFAIDNTVIDSKLEDLRRKIVEVASQQPYWGEEIPARWLPLEQKLMRMKDDGVKVISRIDVENINKEGAVPIENSEELDVFLRFLHETGTIIYFSDETLRDNIVLEPEWLIDALKSLINAQPNPLKSPANNDSHSKSPADSDVAQKWSDFKEKGILTLELVDAVWTKEKYPKLHAHKDHILLIMEQLNIIAKPRSFSEIGEKVENYFLTPCMLRQESPREVISPEQDPRMVSTPVLCWVFTGKFLPPPIFHRLLAACVAHWPVAKKKDTSDNLIFCGCCIFDLGLFHRLILHCRNHIVFARITRMVIDEVRTPDAKLCARVRKFITLNLSKITSYLSQNLKCEIRIQCPSSQGISEDDMVGFSPPFQMWLTDEGQDSDSAIVPEHMNYARLCIALATVCGNALRNILCNHVPKPHTDIYQAILYKKTDLTSRRQSKPALLNQDQILMVFSNPLGQNVAAVDQFDISLLYILIRNVSKVKAPVLGWGIDPLDHPRDGSLGASVERIRIYRNLISAHSAKGQISQQDFEDYWNKINAVLRDIDDVAGTQVHSHELDKQKRRVITIYEAC